MSLIKVAKTFRNATNLQIILPPIMAHQLGLINDPRGRLGAIPFTLKELKRRKEFGMITRVIRESLAGVLIRSQAG